MGPAVASGTANGSACASTTRPALGRKPRTLPQPAGFLSEPAWSLPSATGSIRSAKRHGRSTARPARRARGVVGVARRAENGVVGLRAQPELGHVGLGRQHRARRPDARHERRVGLGHPVGEHGRALGEPQPLGLGEVLHREGHAVEPPARAPGGELGVPLPGLAQERLLGPHRDDRVGPPIVPLDGVEAGAHRLDGGELAGVDGAGEPDRAHLHRPAHAAAPRRRPGRSRV